VLVLGDLVPEEEATREAFQADGTRHTRDLAACILNLEPASDWLLRMDDERCYITDAVLGDKKERINQEIDFFFRRRGICLRAFCSLWAFPTLSCTVCTVLCPYLSTDGLFGRSQ